MPLGRVLVRPVVLMMFLAFVVALVGLAGQDQHDEFLRALDTVMPVEDLPRLGASIRARMYQDLYTDYPEFWLEVHHSGLRNDSMEVRAPDGPSVYQQLDRLRESHPEAPLDELTKSLRIKKWKLRPEDCPEVRQDVRSLPTATWYRGNLITLHPMVHEISFRLGHAEGRFRITDDQQPPVLWLLELRDVLEGCVVRKDPEAFFLTRGTWGLSTTRWAEVNGFLQLQLPTGEAFGVLQILRADVDRDGLLDMLVLYVKETGEHHLELGEALQLIPGTRIEVEPFEIGGPETQARLVSAGAGEIHLSLETFEEWPPPPTEVESTKRQQTVYFRNGQLTSTSPDR